MLLTAVFVIAVVAFVYYYYTQYPKVNHLISGVPYYGVYNHLFDADRVVVTSAADILGYWQDSRFSLEDLVKTFSNVSPTTAFSTLQKFFRDNGYETYRWVSAKPGKELRQIKKFVNQEKQIPLIVVQKRSANPERYVRGSRVVIGVFDDKEIVVTHDHDFGNNYEITYSDFLAMFQPNSRAILAVWPSQELAKTLPPRSEAKPYPQRFDWMEQAGQILVKAADAIGLHKRGQNSEAIILSKEVIEDSSFNLFPPAYKVALYDNLADYLIADKKPDEAIDVLLNKALPLNHNLDQPAEGWTGQIEVFKAFPRPENERRFSTPYLLLAKAYLEKGEQEKAIENLEQALKIYPDNKEAEELLQSLSAS